MIILEIAWGSFLMPLTSSVHEEVFGYSDFSPNLLRKILSRFCLHTNFLFPQDERGQ